MFAIVIDPSTQIAIAVTVLGTAAIATVAVTTARIQMLYVAVKAKFNKN